MAKGAKKTGSPRRKTNPASIHKTPPHRYAEDPSIHARERHAVDFHGKPFVGKPKKKKKSDDDAAAAS